MGKSQIAGISCLDRFQFNVAGLDDVMNMGLAVGAGVGTETNDPDAWITCNNAIMDSYFTYHAILDTKYDDCMKRGYWVN